MKSKKKEIKAALYKQAREERDRRKVQDRANLELIASFSGAGLWLTSIDPVIGLPRFVKFARGSHRLVFDLALYDEGEILCDLDSEVADNPPKYLNGPERLFKDSINLVYEKLHAFKSDYEYSCSFNGDKWPAEALLEENDPSLDERQELLIVCNYNPYGGKKHDEDHYPLVASAYDEPEPGFILRIAADLPDRDFVMIEGNAISRMRFIAFQSRAFIVFTRYSTDSTITFGYLDKDQGRRVFDALKAELDSHRHPGSCYTMSEILED